jgi:hypothetical protein
MLQELVAGIIVALAVLYAGAKYLPDSWRRAIVHRLSKGGRQSWLASWLASWLVKRLDTSASCGSGCNTCGPTEPTPPAGKGNGKVIRIHERR